MNRFTLRIVLFALLSFVVVLPATAAKQKPAGVTTVRSGTDTMTVDPKSGEVRVLSLIHI